MDLDEDVAEPGLQGGCEEEDLRTRAPPRTLVRAGCTMARERARAGPA